MENPNVVVPSDFGPIIININDMYIGPSICSTGYWAIDDINFIKAIIEVQLTKFETVTFYDVGANIGTHSLAISKIFSDKVKVRAFEAQRQIYYMLCGTMAINGVTNVFCYHNAVSDKDNELLDIETPDYNVRNNFGGYEVIEALKSDNQDMVKNGFDSIETISIDSFDEKVDFIKFDIEGMEDKALMGATNCFKKHRPICFVEIMKTDRDYIWSFFEEKNYNAYVKLKDVIFIPKEYKIKIDDAKKLF